MSSFGSGSTTTAGSSIVLTAFEGTNGVKAGTDGLVPGPAVAQAGYLLGAGGDWVLTTPAIVGIAENSERIATTRFVQAVVADAQIPGGNANLAALGDVGIGNLAAGQFLQYNDGSGDWENITLTLDTISNVNLAGLQNGQAIVWNGAEWVPGAIGAVNNLNDLGDVTLAGEADKHFLVHNGAGQFVNRLVSSADLSNSANITLADGTVAFTGNVSLGDFNITNVGDVALDTISADGTTISVSMTDNTGSAFSIKEGNTTYLRVDTTDDLEQIVLEKPASFTSNAIFENNVVVNESGNGVDFRVETGTKTHAIFTNGGTDRVGIFQDNPTVPLDIVGDTKIAGGLEITGNITAANLGTASANDVGDFLSTNAGLGDLAGVVIGGVGLAINQVLMYTGANQFENRPFASTLLSDGENIIRKSSSIGDLFDINLDGLDNGEILVYDEVTEKFIPTGQGAVYGDEQARDAAAAALAAGQNTGITFANDDVNDRINATVSLTGFSIRDLSDVADAALVNGNILKVVNGVLTQAADEGLSTEQVQDIVGAMVNGGTETDITVSYDDAAGKLDFVVDASVARLASPIFTGTPTADTAAHDTNTTQLATTQFVLSQIAGTNINVLEGINTAGNADGKILKFNGAGNLVVADDDGKTEEQIEDIVGGMVAGNNESGITVTYADNADAAGKLNFAVSVSNAEIANNAAIAVNKLASSSVTIGTTEITLGGDSNTLSGMEGIDFTNANATIGASMTNDGENPPVSTTLTLGGAGSTVAIAGSLQSAGLANLNGGIAVATNKFTVSAAGAVVSVGGITDTTVASSFFTGTTIGDIRISNGEIITTDGDNNLSFSDNNLSTTGNLTINTDKFVVTGATGNTTIGGELSLSDGNITNVGDISLDTISSGGTTVQVLMDDNVAGAFEVKTTSNEVEESFIKVDTTDGSEKITIGNDLGNIDVALDLTNTVATVSTPTQDSHIANKEYVDDQVIAAGNVTQLTNLSDVTIGVVEAVGVAEAVGQVLRLSTLVDGDATYKNEHLDLDDLSSITLGVVNGVGVAKAEGQVLRLSADDSTFVNAQLAASDLSGTTNIGLSVLNAADKGAARTAIEAQASNARLDDIAGLANTADNFIAGNGANLVLKTPTEAITSLGLGIAQNQILIGAAAANTFDTIATTANGRSFLASEAGINDLSDVVITGADVPVNLDAHILVFDGDDQGGDNDKFKNVALSGDITITNAGVATIAADAILTDKIKDGEVTNAKLENSYVTISDGTNADNIPLGQTFTFSNVENETTVVVTADQGAGADGVTITIGLPDDVNIGQDLSVGRDATITRNLTVTGDLIVNGATTTINTATLDIEDTIIRLNKGVADLNDGAGGANPNDIGVFFERGTTGDDAIFYWDEGDDFFKLGLTTNDDHEATDFGATTTPGGLQIATLEMRDNLATSFVIQSADDDAAYITFNTLNADPGDGSGFEQVEFKKIFKAITGSKIGNMTLGDGSITDSSGAISFGDENLSTTGSLGAGATTVTSLSVTDGNITHVGDISLDTISSDGSTIQVLMDDDVASAFEVKVPVVNDDDITYFKVDTSDGEELITFEKNVVFNGTTNISANFDQAITINESGADADFIVKGQIDNGVVPTVLATDAANKRVGVGTAAPSTTLHVIGDTTFESAITHNSGAVAFNSDLEDFDFKVSGVGEANLLFVDASAASIGIGKNNPGKTLDITGTLGVSSTTTLANNLEITTNATNGITFRSEVENNEADGNATLLRVNLGGNGADPAPANPVYKKIHWVAATDDFSVESGLISEGDFTVGADKLTVNASNGNTAIAGTLGVSSTTTINNAEGLADLKVQNAGVNVFEVDASAGATKITGQLKTDDLRALTADGGGNDFKIRIEDNVPNALEISDASAALSFMVFDTTNNAEVINLNQDTSFTLDATFKSEISIENTNTNGLFFNSNRADAASENATIITIERGTDGADAVLSWNKDEKALNLNAQAQMHLQGINLGNALTIGGVDVANGTTITMTTAGAITLAGTLDSPTINTDKITDKTGDGLIIELADNDTDALLIRQGAAGENYITLSSENGENDSSQKITLHQKTTVSNTLAVSMQTTLGGILNLKSNLEANGVDVANPLIKANSDLIAAGAERDATLIEVERGILTNAKFKWDETSNCFEFDQILSAEGNFQVGADAAAPEVTINSTTGNIETSGSITTDSVLNFTTASDGAIVFNSDLGGGVAPANTDDFGLTVNRGSSTDAKVYWDESDTSWKIETGDVHTQNKLVIDSAEANKIEIEAGSITTANNAGIDFGTDNLTTTGTIDAATPALRDAVGGLDDSTQVATTAWVLDLRLGDFDQVNTAGFDANDQVLVWDQDNSTFKAGTAVYDADDARTDVGTALTDGTHTGAETITFTKVNDVINLALGITSRNLTDVHDVAPTDTQVLRYVNANSRYEPTSLGTAADVDTGLSNGNIPTLTTHTWSTKTNEVADLIITGRYIEAFDFGSVDEAFDPDVDWALDYGSVTDAGISSWEDYGQLVV